MTAAALEGVVGQSARGVVSWCSPTALSRVTRQAARAVGFISIAAAQGLILVPFLLGPASLTLTNSIISGNVAGDSGGGIYSYSSFQASIVTLTDSAISGNMASGDGGGVSGYFCGGTLVTLINSTSLR